MKLGNEKKNRRSYKNVGASRKGRSPSYAIEGGS